MSLLVKPALVIAAAVGVALGFSLEQGGPPTAAPPRDVVVRGPRLDATSDAEARQMRRALIILAGQTAAGARCDAGDRPDRFASCAVPALRRLGMGGPMAVDVLNAVITGIPFGRCRGYLLRLQAAAQAAGEQAHWLLPHIYGPDRRRAQHKRPAHSSPRSPASCAARRPLHRPTSADCARQPRKPDLS
jgi:hypothetical protein